MLGAFFKKAKNDAYVPFFLSRKEVVAPFSQEKNRQESDYGFEGPPPFFPLYNNLLSSY